MEDESAPESGIEEDNSTSKESADAVEQEDDEDGAGEEIEDQDVMRRIKKIIFVRDNRAVCPSCSGLITARQNYYICLDCRSAFIGIDHGRVEGEVIVEAVEKD